MSSERLGDLLGVSMNQDTYQLGIKPPPLLLPDDPP